MRVLIGVLILLLLSLAGSSPRWWRFRRTSIGAALTTGGWVMVAIGMMLGPHGAGLLGGAELEALRPVALFLLAWVGLVVGLGADRRLSQIISAPLVRVMLTDAGLSGGVMGGACAGLLLLGGAGPAAAIAAGIVVGICSVGWSSESRSLSAGAPGMETTITVLRAVSGLLSLGAVGVFGLLLSWVWIDGGGSITVSRLQVTARVTAAVLIGLAMGGLGKWMMDLAKRSEAEFVVVLLGVVAFTAGSPLPLTSGVLAGAVLVNLPGEPVLKLRRSLMEAEQAIGMGVMLVAGLYADPAMPWIGWAAAGAVALGRVGVKMGVMRRAVAMTTGADPRAGVLGAVLRQSPLALAMAAAFAIGPVRHAEVGGLSGGAVLMVVIVSGAVCEVLPLVWSPRNPRGNGRGEARAGWA